MLLDGVSLSPMTATNVFPYSRKWITPKGVLIDTHTSLISDVMGSTHRIKVICLSIYGKTLTFFSTCSRIALDGANLWFCLSPRSPLSSYWVKGAR